MKKIKPGKNELNVLRNKAESGNTLAQYELAAVLATGFMGEQCIEESFFWYMTAAERGHVEASWNAGLMLVDGEGIERNTETGLKLIFLAANEYCYGACRFLGDSFRSGIHGLSVDKQQSEYWYDIAEQRGEINTEKISSKVEKAIESWKDNGKLDTHR